MKASQLVTKIYDTESVDAQVRKMEHGVNLSLHDGSLHDALAAVGGGQADDERVIYMIRPEDLQVMEGLNPRVPNDGYKAHIRQLVDSMKAHGFFPDKPVAGFVAKEGAANVILVTEGGSRLAAAVIAKDEGATFDKIPVVIEQDGKSIEDILIAMSRSNTGKALTPFETGVICSRLASFGRDSKRIAHDLGVTQQYVEMLLKLMAADRRIRDMVAHEIVAANIAIEMINKYGEQAYDMLVTAETAANKAGKKKITGRFLASTIVQRAAKKAAVPMYEVLKDIKADPCFAGLSDDIQEKLQNLLDELEKVEEKALVTEATKRKAEAKNKSKEGGNVIPLRAA